MFFFLLQSLQRIIQAFKISDLVFILTQYARDEKLMRSLINFLVPLSEEGGGRPAGPIYGDPPPLLECGKFYKKGEVLEFKVFKFYDIYNKIIPLFKKYPIQGVKNKDFKDLCHVASMMKENKHLTKKKLRGAFFF